MTRIVANRILMGCKNFVLDICETDVDTMFIITHNWNIINVTYNKNQIKNCNEKQVIAVYEVNVKKIINNSNKPNVLNTFLDVIKHNINIHKIYAQHKSILLFDILICQNRVTTIMDLNKDGSKVIIVT